MHRFRNRLFPVRNNRSKNTENNNNTQTDKIKDDSGKYTEEKSRPLVRTKDLHNGIVQVEMLIIGLEPGQDKYHHKGGAIWFDLFNDGWSFDMETVLEDKVKMVRTTYKFTAKQLPGRINTCEKNWKVEKGKIVVKLEKHPDDINIDWDPIVKSRGIKDESSSSSDDD